MHRARKFAGAALTASLVTMGGIGTTVASAGAAHAATCTAAQYAADLNKVSKRAENLINRLESLTTSSSASAVRAEQVATVKDLSDMNGELSAATATLQQCGQLAPADVPIVTNALDNLTAVSQAALAYTTSKHPIFAQFQATAAIAAVLRSLEASLDSYTFALIAVAPTGASDISSDQAALDTAVGNTTVIYSEVCIPSPLYPILMPICARG